MDGRLARVPSYPTVDELGNNTTVEVGEKRSKILRLSGVRRSVEENSELFRVSVSHDD